MIQSFVKNFDSMKVSKLVILFVFIYILDKLLKLTASLLLLLKCGSSVGSIFAGHFA